MMVLDLPREKKNMKVARQTRGSQLIFDSRSSGTAAMSQLPVPQLVALLSPAAAAR